MGDHSDINHAGLTGVGIPATILDAKGDLIAASAADTAARVAVGANGSSLRANSGASAGVEWQLNKYDATVAPTANEDTGDGYSVGSIWIDVTGDAAYICVDASTAAAVWLPFDSASGESWEGAWSAGTYTTGQIVEHNDVIYQANTTTTDEPPSGDWDVLYTAPAGGGPLLYQDSIALHTDGDEFDDDTLPGWTLGGGLTLGDVTAVTTEPYDDDCLDIVFAAAGDRMLKTVPAGDNSIILTIHGITNSTPSSLNAAGQMMAIVRVDSSGNGVGVSMYNDGSVYTWTIASYAYSATGTGIVAAWHVHGVAAASNMPLMLRLRKSGTNYYAGLSYNGGLSWQESPAQSNGATHDRFGIMALFGGGGTNPSLRVGRLNIV